MKGSLVSSSISFSESGVTAEAIYPSFGVLARTTSSSQRRASFPRWVNIAPSSCLNVSMTYFHCWQTTRSLPWEGKSWEAGVFYASSQLSGRHTLRAKEVCVSVIKLTTYTLTGNCGSWNGNGNWVFGRSSRLAVSALPTIDSFLTCGTCSLTQGPLSLLI